MNVILIAVISLGVIALVSAAILYVASKKFAVYEDPRIAQVAEVLPQANCGGCGYPGCSGFADACVKAGSLDGKLCPVGGQPVMTKIAEILGLDAAAAEPMVAVVRCNGTCANRPRVNQYDGAKSCAIAASLYGGETGCSTLPSFVQFINFLGPLLGIALGFDAINSEQNKGTLSRMLSQPVHRDCIINAKFVAALIVIGIMLFVLGFLVMGCGLIAIGIPPTAEEFWRIVSFLIISVFYVAFWLNLAILFSLCFRQAATSALASVAVWLFFSVFYTMIVNLVAKALSPSQLASPYQIVSYQKFILGLMRLAPSELFNEATTTLLMPSVRSLGPLTMEQVQGAIPSPLPLGQSLLVVWPQLTGLIAATVICFALSYVIFMRREVRSR